MMYPEKLFFCILCVQLYGITTSTPTCLKLITQHPQEVYVWQLTLIGKTIFSQQNDYSYNNLYRYDINKQAVMSHVSVFCYLGLSLLSYICTLRTPWSNCYRTATASELIWLRRNVTGGRFSNPYQRAYFAYANLANHRRCVLSCSLTDSDVVDHGAD